MASATLCSPGLGASSRRRRHRNAFGRRTPRPEVLLLPGTGSVPTQPVLTLLDAALRGVGPEGGPAKLLVAQPVQRNRQLVAQVCVR